ncbi:hypothetical protein ABK040_005577 [Willaertia magna]
MLENNVSEIDNEYSQLGNVNNYNNNNSEKRLKDSGAVVLIYNASSLSHSLSNATVFFKTNLSFKMNTNASFLQKFELGLENKVVTIVGLKLNNFDNCMDTVTDNKEIVSVMTNFSNLQQLAKPKCNIDIALKEKLSQFINSEWNSYNEGYELYLEGKFEEALDKFELHLQRNVNDRVCRRVIELCNK